MVLFCLEAVESLEMLCFSVTPNVSYQL